MITNHNRARYVADALRSVACQSYGDFEAVVVDDASTDDSCAAIQAELAALGDSRFSFVALPENGGQMAALKAGFDRLSAPFFAPLDSDDMWHPRYLEAHVEAHLNCAHSAGFTASDMAIVDRDGRMVMGSVSFHGRRRGELSQEGAWTIPSSSLPRFEGDAPVFDAGAELQLHDEISWRWPWVGTSAMVFRRALLGLIMPGRTDQIRISADFYLAFLGQFISGSILIGETLGYYRIHGDNGFATNLLLGGVTPLTDRDQSAIHGVQRRMIVTKFTEDRQRLTSVIGEHRYQQVMALLKPDADKPPARKQEPRRRFWRR